MERRGVSGVVAHPVWHALRPPAVLTCPVGEVGCNDFQGVTGPVRGFWVFGESDRVLEKETWKPAVVTPLRFECVVALLELANHLIRTRGDHTGDQFTFLICIDVVEPIVDLRPDPEETQPEAAVNDGASEASPPVGTSPEPLQTLSTESVEPAPETPQSGPSGEDSVQTEPGTTNPEAAGDISGTTPESEEALDSEGENPILPAFGEDEVREGS